MVNLLRQIMVKGIGFSTPQCKMLKPDIKKVHSLYLSYILNYVLIIFRTSEIKSG